MANERIIFMGTSEISEMYLKSLLDSHYNIIAVYSQPPRKKGRGMKVQESSIQKLAQLHNIQVFTPKDFNSETTKKELQDLHPDLIIVMGYGLKLTKPILELADSGCINVHVSLLPRWRGAAPIEHALLNGDKKTGITIFKLVEKMDAGPILVKDEIAIDQHINKGELIQKLNQQGTKLLNFVLPKIFNNENTLVPQDENKVTYAHKISPVMRKLNFKQEVEVVYNTIRAFAPQPSAWFIFDNERIKIIKASFKKGNFQPSTILNDQFHIGCNNGQICPEIIQREGKKPMELKEFLKGFKFIVGSKIDA